ncbi:MAG: AbrB/MazE/SpoVT family DNA-binding domain-containing protein [Betaproteobacteria bacterium]
MSRLKIVQIGDDCGVILPREWLTRLKPGTGDTLNVSVIPNGISLAPIDPDIDDQIVAARTIMKKRHTVLREIGK